MSAMVDTEAPLQAVALLIVVFLGMRVLYGCWPWEGHKTWYATKRLLRSVEENEEGIVLSPEQIDHAVGSAALITNSQLENEKNSRIGNERAGLIVKALPSSVDLAAQKSAA